MPNTESHVTGFVDRIHTSVLLSEAPDSIHLGLSSHEQSLAQIELRHLEIRRSLGRKVLHMDILDLSGMPQHLGRSDTSSLKIHLGHAVVLGRGRFDLPVFGSESVSENHLELSFHEGENGPLLGIHDYASVNGSHIVDPSKEASWEESRQSYEKVALPRVEEPPVQTDYNYDFLYGPEVQRYSFTKRS